jgi:protein CpxP
MKNITPILVFVFAFNFIAQAQKKENRKKPQFTIKQQTSLKVKQMTLVLNLSDKQKSRIQPLILAAIADKQTFIKKRRASRKDKKRPSSDQIYLMKSNMLDKRIAMKSNMKAILNETQFKRFEKIQKTMMIKKNAKKTEKRPRRSPIK